MVKSRSELIKDGLRQCVKCGIIHAEDAFSSRRNSAHAWCQKCTESYQFNNGYIQTGESLAMVAFDEFREKEYLESCGFRKCTNCSFTLPINEFTHKKTECKKCTHKDRGLALLNEHLHTFNHAKCSDCEAVKTLDSFYTNDAGKRRSTCLGCDSKNKTLYREKNFCAIGIDGADKKCRKCKEVKKIQSFGISKGSIDGRNSMCLVCAREYSRSYRVSNKDRLTDYHRKWCLQNKTVRASSRKKYVQSHPEVSRNAMSKRRAMKRNLPHSPITKEQEARLLKAKADIFFNGSVPNGESHESL